MEDPLLDTNASKKQAGNNVPSPASLCLNHSIFIRPIIGNAQEQESG